MQEAVPQGGLGGLDQEAQLPPSPPPLPQIPPPLPRRDAASHLSAMIPGGSTARRRRSRPRFGLPWPPP